MTEPFLGQIMIFAGNFAPLNWAFCNGQILSIQQNSALYSLLGTTYGGDGKTTFALPNFQGSVPLGMGQGAGLKPYTQGQKGGAANVTLLAAQLPAHNHQAQAVTASTATAPGTGVVWGASTGGRTPPPAYVAGSTNSDVTMNPNATGMTGNNQAHNNVQPVLALNFVIALEGIYPQRP